MQKDVKVAGVRLRTSYGWEIEPSEWRRSDYGWNIIGRPELAPAGNLVLRVGRVWEDDPTSWRQTGHVVMSPEEAADFIAQCQARLDGRA